MKNTDEFSVDIVYLWCDGNDNDFKNRKLHYQRLEKDEKIRKQ